MSASADHPSVDPVRLQTLFLAARELTGDPRKRYLDAACGDDARMRTEVESLLAHDAVSESFLEVPILQGLMRALGPDVRPGDRVGRYRIDAYLARGGSGHVFRATDLAHGGEVALKVTAALGAGPAARERVLDEARHAQAVSHPSLVRVFDVGEDEELGVCFCAMQRIRGPSLAEVLEEFGAAGRRPDAGERRRIVERLAEVGEGLAVVHATGMAHRDVKPANIVLDADAGSAPLLARAVLVDFGLAGSARAVGAASTVWASFDYAAPEQVLGQQVGPTADVFGLGLTAYDLLTGKRPSERSRATAGPLVPLTTAASGVDRRLAAVIAMATDPEPAWRYRDGGAFAGDLRAWLAGGPLAALSVPRLARWSRRLLRIRPNTVKRLTRGLALVGIGVVSLLVVQLASGLDRFRRQTGEAWQTRDLEALAAALHSPPRLGHLVLESSVRELEAPTPGAASDLHDVYALGLRDGWDAALRQAAVHLERDGPARQPDLTRFMTVNLRGARARHTLSLLARVFFERPIADSSDLAVCAAMRAAACSVIGADPVGAPTMDAAVMLGGCGDASTLEPLIALVDRSVSTVDDQRTECQRVGLRAIITLVRRLSFPLDGVRPLTAAQSDRLGAIAARALASVAGNGIGAQRMMRTVADLEVELALARHPIRRQIPALASELDVFVVRAARGDPALRRDVAAGVDPPPTVRDGWPIFKERAPRLGCAAALLGDPDCTRQLRAWAVDGPDPEHLQTLFADGWQSGVALLRGMVACDAPDPDTHLAAGLSAPADAAPAATVVNRFRAGEGTFAGLDLWHGTPTVWSTEDRVWLHAASSVLEEARPDTTFLRLARPGISSVVFETTIPPGIYGCVLRVWAQQGARVALPYEGTATLDVLVDGEVALADVTLRGPAAGQFRVPLCEVTHARRRRIEVRLGSRSTTTVRVYELTLGKE